jgi:hypothetical protein
VVYHTLNGAVAAFALWVLVVNDAGDMSSQMGQLQAVLAAGFGFVLVMRSRFFTMRVGNEEVAFGPLTCVTFFAP